LCFSNQSMPIAPEVEREQKKTLCRYQTDDVRGRRETICRFLFPAIIVADLLGSSITFKGAIKAIGGKGEAQSKKWSSEEEEEKSQEGVTPLFLIPVLARAGRARPPSE